MSLIKSTSRSAIGRELVRLLGNDELVLSGPGDRIAYSYDATGDMALPEAVVVPSGTAAVAKVMAWAAASGVPVVPRGAGTNLSGGTVPIAGGIVLELSRLAKVLSTDLSARTAVVGPGITNLALQDFLAPLGYCFAPDPASQKVSTLGGNVAENAGGPHCLKYGVTADHILGLVAVLADGEVVRLGQYPGADPGLNSAGALVGSEGTLAVFTEILIRLEPLPPAVKTILAVFDRLEDAGRTVSAIIAERMLPATLELMDRTTLNVVEESFRLGYPTDAEGALLIELDGPAPGLERQAAAIDAICRDLGARSVSAARDEDERSRLWLGRRSAFGALARRSPIYSVQDATVPRDRLVEIMRHVEEVGSRHGLDIAIVAHAGDGNLHPIVLYGEHTPERVAKVHHANEEILRRAVEMGGTISGEHGVGLEKLDFVALALDEPALALMRRVKGAFDPQGRLNPGKAIPPAKTAPPGTAQVRRPDAPLAQLADQVGEAVAGGRMLAIAGGGSRRPWALGVDGREGDDGRGVVSTAGLLGIVELDAANLTVRVRAGTSSSDLRDALDREGFWLPPLDHNWHGTVGGDVSTAHPSPCDTQLGGIARWALGAEILTAAAGVVRLGGKTLKNVTGYNLMPLLTGSYGQLALIAEVTFRVWPKPESDVTLVMPLAGDPIDHAVLDRLVRNTRPLAVAAGGGGLPGCTTAEPLLLVRLAGMAEDVEWSKGLWADRLPVRALQPSAAQNAWRRWSAPFEAAAESGFLAGFACPAAALPGWLADAAGAGPAWSACVISGIGQVAATTAASAERDVLAWAAGLTRFSGRWSRRGAGYSVTGAGPGDRRFMEAFGSPGVFAPPGGDGR